MTTINTDMQEYKFYVNGELKSAADGKTIDCINPSTGEIFAKVADAGIDDMKAAISAARRAFDSGDWSYLSAKDRAYYLMHIAELIRDHAKVLAELETLSTGKTAKHATFIDVPTCAETFEYFGQAYEL